VLGGYFVTSNESKTKQNKAKQTELIFLTYIRHGS